VGRAHDDERSHDPRASRNPKRIQASVLVAVAALRTKFGILPPAWNGRIDIMEDEPCPQRRALERAVVEAVQKQYAAKGDERTAARLVERKAVKALQHHTDSHGCKPA
jgi:hypothetical protein